MRVNVSWHALSDTGSWATDRGSFFRRQLEVFKPRVVQAAGPRWSMSTSTWRACTKLADGTKGVVQPLGNFRATWTPRRTSR